MEVKLKSSKERTETTKDRRVVDKSHGMSKGKKYKSLKGNSMQQRRLSEMA